MDVQTIDSHYAQLQTQSQQTQAAIQTLATKLQTAAAAGDTNAREYLLDLKDIAIGVKDENMQTSNLLQALHDFVVNQTQEAQQAAAQPVPQAPSNPSYAGQSYGGGYGGYGGGGFGGGGGMRGFMGSMFGRAIVQGAGFGIGDDLINKIF